MRIPAARARLLLAVPSATVSLDTRIGNDNGAELGDFLADTQTAPTDASLVDAERVARVERALAGLSGKEREVLRLRFGIGMDDEHTLEEIGARFSLTRERIRQIEAKALGKLRRLGRLEDLRTLIEAS